MLLLCPGMLRSLPDSHKVCFVTKGSGSSLDFSRQPMLEILVPTRTSRPLSCLSVSLTTFSQSEGAFCESPGQPWNGQACSFEHSTCGNKTEDCHGRGPGFRISDFESNRIIAQKQVDGAKSLMGGQDVSRMGAINGPVGWVHVYLNM